MNKKAVVIGATGLVGSAILKQLIQDERIDSIDIFVRKSSQIKDSKLNEHIVNFDDITSWRGLIRGDILFSALGTTLKQSGSRQAQRVVDYNYQLQIIQSAKINGIENLVLVSAPNAHPKSMFAYTRIKGELERDVLKLEIPKTTIIRPGLLRGVRAQKRFFEHQAGVWLNYLPTIPGLEAIKPIDGEKVAHVCIESALDNFQGARILNPKEVITFA